MFDRYMASASAWTRTAVWSWSRNRAAKLLRYECGPAGTLMWITLRQHDDNLDAAALALSRLWGMAPSNVRAELDTWVAEMCDAGLVCVELP